MEFIVYLKIILVIIQFYSMCMYLKYKDEKYFCTEMFMLFLILFLSSFE